MVMTAAWSAQLADEMATRESNHRRIHETTIIGPQGARVTLADGREVLNLSSNDYLGFANDPGLRAAAIAAQESWGLGSAAGRIVTGTFGVHQRLETELSTFLGTEASLLFTSCFDANAGLFEALMGADDLILSDGHNHASIIDGIRLSRARRATYPTRDLAALRNLLLDAGDARRILIVSDAVFSMDGDTADVPALCALAEEFGALLVIDDSHGIGVLGREGRGVSERAGCTDRVDLVTGTFGKAFGGVGGFISGRRELIDALRQTSRPYLFSNSMPAASAELMCLALEQIQADATRHRGLRENVAIMRAELAGRGLEVPEGDHPIIPVIVGAADTARAAATLLLERGVLVAALTYPIVAANAARLRVQVSASHDPDDLRAAAGTIATAVADALANTQD